MELVSAFASGIALCQGAMAIAKIVKLIRNLDQVPLEIYQFLNQLETLRVLAEQVGETLKGIGHQSLDYKLPSKGDPINLKLLSSLKYDIVQIVDEFELLGGKVHDPQLANGKGKKESDNSVWLRKTTSQ